MQNSTLRRHVRNLKAPGGSLERWQLTSTINRTRRENCFWVVMRYEKRNRPRPGGERTLDDFSPLVVRYGVILRLDKPSSFFATISVLLNYPPRFFRYGPKPSVPVEAIVRYLMFLCRSQYSWSVSSHHLPLFKQLK